MGLMAADVRAMNVRNADCACAKLALGGYIWDTDLAGEGKRGLGFNALESEFCKIASDMSAKE